MEKIDYFTGPSCADVPVAPSSDPRANAPASTWWKPRVSWPWVTALLIGGAIVVAGFGFAFAPARTGGGGGGEGSYTYVPVERGTLEIVYQERGELRSLENVDISCPVEGMNTIQQIVPEGSFVKKGDVICTLDPTEIRRNLDTAEIDLEKADADVKWAIEQKRIQEVKNAADLDAANSELTLAQIDLKEYTEGEYPAQLQEAQRKLEMTSISLKRKEEELAASRRLLDRAFITLSEVQKSELELVTARNDREKAAADLEVLRDYKHEKDLAEKKNKVSQAENKVARTLDENTSNLNQKDSDLHTKQRQLAMHKATTEHARTQFENCTIKAPTDGMVLYASSIEEFVRDQPIQAGAKVVQQQLIVRLPDVSKMKAVVKIAESKVARLRVDPDHPIRAEVSIVGLPAPIGASLTKVGVLPDNTWRWLNPDSKDYPVDLTLDTTPSGLKPGSSTSVKVNVGAIPGATIVPLGAIYSVGEEHYVFGRARDGKAPEAKKVKIGESNTTHVQITEGLSPGEQVVLLEPGQGRDLLGNKSMSAAPAAAKPTAPAPATPAAETPTTRPAVAMALLH